MLGQLASIERFFHYIDKKGNQQAPSPSRRWPVVRCGYSSRTSCGCDTDLNASTIGKLFEGELDEDSGDGNNGEGIGGEPKHGREGAMSPAIASYMYSTKADGDEDTAFSSAAFKSAGESSTVRSLWPQYRMTMLASQSASGEEVKPARRAVHSGPRSVHELVESISSSRESSSRGTTMSRTQVARPGNARLTTTSLAVTADAHFVGR